MFIWEEITPEHDVVSFDCGNAELNDFLKNDALDSKHESFSNTILFYTEEKELIGYVTTSTDAIRLSKKERKKLHGGRFELAEYPSVKIARLAIAKEKQRKGLGGKILFWTITYMKQHIKHIGARFVTIDAVPEAEEFYKKFYFIRNLHERHKQPNRITASMRLDMHVV